MNSIKLQPNRRFPSIPNVGMSLQNHTEVLQALKEAMEVGKRDTSDVLNSYVRVKDLVDMGFATLNSGLLVPAEFASGGGTGTDDQTAAEVSYDNTTSGLTADDVQEAIDELAVAGGAAADAIEELEASQQTANFNLSFFFPATPTSSQLMAKFVAPDYWTIPGNMAGSYGHIGTDPTGSFVMDVAKNGSNFGTITVSTAGVFSFATASGLPVDFSPGDLITVTAPSSTDATAADFGVTLALEGTVLGFITPNRIEVGFFYPGVPANNQLLSKFMAPLAFSLPANFVGAYGSVGTNPTALATLTVYLNGANVGTASISTGGVFTFATTGGAAISVIAGDRIEVEAQASADATLADIGMTLVGTL